MSTLTWITEKELERRRRPIPLEERRNNFIYNDGRKKASSCGKFMHYLGFCLLTAEADRVLYHLLIVLTFFVHWMYKMKYCYKECFTTHGWSVY